MGRSFVQKYYDVFCAQHHRDYGSDRLGIIRHVLPLATFFWVVFLNQPNVGSGGRTVWRSAVYLWDADYVGPRSYNGGAVGFGNRYFSFGTRASQNIRFLRLLNRAFGGNPECGLRVDRYVCLGSYYARHGAAVSR